MTSERHSRGGRTAAAVWKGAALLGGAALLSKLIGTLQKIPLQNLAGDRVFGLYSAVGALATMWMALAAAGIPAAVSALVAERHALGDEAGGRRVARWSVALLAGSGLLAFALLQAGAGPFAAWMGAPEAERAIRAAAAALLFAPAAAGLRGFAQGRMEMVRPAVSQLLEQTARVAFMLAALVYGLKAAWSDAAVAAAAQGGLAVGAAAGLAAMLLPRPGIGGASAAAAAAPAAEPPEPASRLVRRIVAVALPVAAGSVSAPLFGLIDAFTLPHLLRGAEGTAASALAAFGEYNRGVALLQLVVMAAGGASAALVPALTAARARGGEGGDSGAAGATQAVAALRLGWWLGGAAAVGLALLAVPVDVALYADSRGSLAIALLAFAAAGGALQAVSAALLQGLGALRAPAAHLAAAALAKAALNAALAPAWGTAGAAVAAALAYALAAALNARALRRRIALPRPRAAAAGRALLALAAMAAAVSLARLALAALARGLPPRAAAALTALPCVAVGAAAFAAALVFAGAAGPRDWRALPGLAGSRADRWLTRLHALGRRAARFMPGRCDD
jgi:O-antigen/teichoic acid export membrane protein